MLYDEIGAALCTAVLDVLVSSGGREYLTTLVTTFKGMKGAFCWHSPLLYTAPLVMLLLLVLVRRFLCLFLHR